MLHQAARRVLQVARRTHDREAADLLHLHLDLPRRTVAFSKAGALLSKAGGRR